MEKSNPYRKFVENPAIRQFMFGMTGARDRNEGGIPSGNPLFDPGFLGERQGSRGLDIDTANLELWKRKMIEEGRFDDFLGVGGTPRTIAVQDMFNAMKSTSVSPYFGIPNRRR